MSYLTTMFQILCPPGRLQLFSVLCTGSKHHELLDPSGSLMSGPCSYYSPVCPCYLILVSVHQLSPTTRVWFLCQVSHKVRVTGLYPLLFHFHLPLWPVSRLIFHVVQHTPLFRWCRSHQWGQHHWDNSVFIGYTRCFGQHPEIIRGHYPSLLWLRQ